MRSTTRTTAARPPLNRRRPDDPSPKARSAVTGNGNLPIEPMLSMTDLCRILNVSRSKLERLRAAGKIPPPDLDLRTVSKPIPRWRPSTINRWIEGGGRL
jgi:hypothetical protein